MIPSHRIASQQICSLWVIPGICRYRAISSELSSMLFPSMGCTDVVVISNRGREVPRLDFFRLSFSLLSLEDVATLLCLAFLVFFSDHSLLTVGMKLWLLQLVYLVYLVWFDTLDGSEGSRRGSSSRRRRGRKSRPHMPSQPFDPSTADYAIPKVQVSEEGVPLLCLRVAGLWEVWRAADDLVALRSDLAALYPAHPLPSLPSYKQVQNELKKQRKHLFMRSSLSLSRQGQAERDRHEGEALVSLSRHVLLFIRDVAKDPLLNQLEPFLAMIGRASYVRREARSDLQRDDPARQTRYRQFLLLQQHLTRLEEARRMVELREAKAQGGVVRVEGGEEEEEDGFCGGRSLKDFSFLDQTAEAKAIGKDSGLTHGFRVRDLDYMESGQKVEAGPSPFVFLHFEYIEVDRKQFGDRHDHIARYGIVRRRLEAIRRRLVEEVESVFLVNIQIPGDPPLSALLYFAVPKAFFKEARYKKASKLFERFRDLPSQCVTSQEEYSRGEPVAAVQTTARAWGRDIVWPEGGEPGVLDRSAFQNKRFKLLAVLVEAPWILRAAVSPTPCLLGQKIVQRYFRGPHYLEVDLHVASSSIAEGIVSLCRTYAKNFVVKFGIILQGEHEEELPEEVLAAATLSRANLETRIPLSGSPSSS